VRARRDDDSPPVVIGERREVDDEAVADVALRHVLKRGVDILNRDGLDIGRDPVVGAESSISKASMGGSSHRQPVLREPDRSSAASASASSSTSTTARRPELVAGGSGPIVYCERLGPRVHFHHWQAA
jgi:hypothetical protein